MQMAITWAGGLQKLVSNALEQLNLFVVYHPASKTAALLGFQNAHRKISCYLKSRRVGCNRKSNPVRTEMSRIDPKEPELTRSLSCPGAVPYHLESTQVFSCLTKRVHY